VSAERHARGKEIFLAVCDQPPAKRDEHLRRTCGDDEALRREVEALLVHHDAATVPQPTPPTPPGRFAIGELFGDRYRVVSRVGRGGMGEVYRAYDEVLGVQVALKLLTGASGERVELLLNEVRLAREVTHPTVCRVFDVGQAGDEHFFTMELIEGEDLSSLQRRIGRLPPDKLLDVARQLAAGLAAAHARGVLHRDLKPTNVMIDADGQVKITDFGIATAALGEDRSGAGTPAYMAPERLAGEPASVKSDLYALGLVLHEMATGKPVFAATTPEEYAALHRSTPPPACRIPDLDPQLEAVILQCLEKVPEDRPTSALAMAAALPGADPLRIALEVGETPSPELVAAAAAGPAIRPGPATVVLALLALALAGVLLLAGRGIGPIKPPEVLADRAAEILRQTGWDEPPRDRVWGFLPNLCTGEEAALLFWYRQSPAPLVALDLSRIAIDDPRVDLYDPPPLDEGMIQVVLDSAGRLVVLHVVPPAPDEEEAEAEPGGEESTQEKTEVDWTVVLRAAGYDPAALTPQTPETVPPVFADQRRAWTGPDPRGTGEELLVDAAAFAGRVVYFDAWPIEEEVVAQGDFFFDFMEGGLLFFNLSLVAVAVAAVVMARINLRRGRGDLRGARSLVVMVVAAKLLYWVLAAHHVPSLDAELTTFHVVLGVVLVEALLVWLAYVALEPTVRRFWPRTLIAWSRLLRGRVRDPEVGRSLLIGTVAGAGWTAATQLDRLAPGWLGLTTGPDFETIFQLEVALNARMPFANLLSSWLAAVYTGVLMLFFLAVLRLLWRRPGWAIATFVVVAAVFEVLSGSHPAVSWLTVGVVVAGSGAWILVRFGLLAYVVAVFASEVLLFSPITLDLSSWHAGSGFFGLLVVALWGGFGFLTALAGQSPGEAPKPGRFAVQ